MTRVTPDDIRNLEPGQVFVFGSNIGGKHGKGAAKFAVQKFGAKWGVGEGLQGSSYGLPTVTANVKQALPLPRIKTYVDNFIEFAKQNPHLTFLVTEVGCGLAGYKCKDIAPLFEAAKDVDNIHLPAKFWHKLDALKPSGKSFNNVQEMLEGLGVSEEVVTKFKENLEE